MADAGENALSCLARVRRALFLHDLETASELCERARVLARREGAGLLEERALCLHAGIAIEARDSDDLIGRLRGVLSTSTDLRNRYIAGYNLARAFELRNETRKAAFHAQSALQWGTLAGVGAGLAASHNQIGNLHLANGELEHAHAAYATAHRICPPGRPLWRAIFDENLGYVKSVLGHRGAGPAMIQRGLQALERLGARSFAATARLSLSFAYLQEGLAEKARELAEVSLLTAVEGSEQSKTALFLLAEAAKLRGEPAEARTYCERLLLEHYPQQIHLLDLLLTVDLRRIINIKV